MTGEKRGRGAAAREGVDTETGEIMSRADGRTFRDVQPDFVTFDREGDAKEGRLRSKSSVDVANGTVGKYTLQADTGELIAFLGGVVLDDAFALIEIGAYVRVEFVSTEKRAGGKTLRHFKVQVAEEGL